MARGWLFILASAAIAWPGAAAAFDLGVLMEKLAAVPASSSSFTETRHSALLSGPLVLTGSLVYQRPDRLEKNVLSPYEERTVIAGTSVTIENRTLKQTRSYSLSSSATASALVESMRATLAGDRASLERHYGVALEGSLASWTMSLTPREQKLASLVKRIQIAGMHERVGRIEIEETSGDRSLMQVGAPQ
jgi:outer membrane lipoprotein-sorting protein